MLHNLALRRQVPFLQEDEPGDGLAAAVEPVDSEEEKADEEDVDNTTNIIQHAAVCTANGLPRLKDRCSDSWVVILWAYSCCRNGGPRATLCGTRLCACRGRDGLVFAHHRLLEPGLGQPSKPQGASVLAIGKRKAADIPVPHSGIKKHKKRLSGKVDGHSNTSSNRFKAIDTLFEEVEAMLRSPSIPPPSSLDTISHKNIPDLFKKRPQMPPLAVEVDLHPPPAVKILTPSPMKRFAPCMEFVECPEVGVPAPPSPEVLVPVDIPCSNRFSALSALSESPEHNLHTSPDEPGKGNSILHSLLTQDRKAQPNGVLDLATISQKLDDLKSLVLLILNQFTGLLEQRAVCNCKLSNEGDPNPVPVPDGMFITPVVLDICVEVPSCTPNAQCKARKHGGKRQSELPICASSNWANA
ncbi:hypothetical protein NDU88_002443 [Pleurodeles waltl]|uniref:Uncharacterized protein n=1 Tax=Pleurodeles waltl TaxID=8319 RepID=A0AAV7T241_PLEWA|nr:hypothetical protein NDU88_002443 [Pleurodeles waltl]